VFAVELALGMVVSAASTFACAIALDRFGMSPFMLTRILGVLFVLPAAWWVLADRWAGRAPSGP